MQTEILIIGQGISGTMLSWFLHKAGKSFLVIDQENPGSPTGVAAGVMNPVTGRKFVTTWMIDTILPFAVQAYSDMETFLDRKFLFRKDIIDIFPNAQMRDAFATRITENDTYLHSYPDQNHFNRYLHQEYGCGQIKPAYTTDLHALTGSWRQYLKEKRLLLDESFSNDLLEVHANTITYKDIRAEKIIFCDGNASMNYPWFQNLPFSPSKGEALIIESEDLTNEHIFKKSMTIVPLSRQHTFWVGSSFQWKYTEPGPTPAFREATKNYLDGWLKVPYRIVDHKAALRPSTLERRPFVGFHPRWGNVGILNGMGTKGTSLSPFFAHQLVQHLLSGADITKEASIDRFHRILSDPAYIRKK
ncbi:FAD-binding oxidoreductase [Paraflavisolibacter sp. H34]|uniref:NAD(P)/FAD-dependent oxidoreductase n=1 Tax=Huijunlia imazamoxiresistens TaxID=3127457 RepID=UPI003018A062